MVLPLLAVPAAAACCGAYANDCIQEVNRRLVEDDGEVSEVIIPDYGDSEESNQDLIRLAQARRGALSISGFNQDSPRTEFRKSNSIDMRNISSSPSSTAFGKGFDFKKKGMMNKQLGSKAFSRTIRFGSTSEGETPASMLSSFYTPRPVMTLDNVGSIEVAQRFVKPSASIDSQETTTSQNRFTFEGGLSRCANTPSTKSMTPSATSASSSTRTFSCPSTPRHTFKLNFDGYIDGKFSDGRVFNVNTSQESWTLAYSPDSALLGIGLENGYGVALYETKRYNLIRRVSTEDTVVDVQWNNLFDSTTYSRQDYTGGARNELERTYLMSAACRNGVVEIHHIKYKVTRKEVSLSNPLGQNKGYSIIALSMAKIQLPTGARCSLFLPTISDGNSNPETVEMAVGEKSGAISIISNIPVSIQASRQLKSVPTVRRIGSHKGAAKCIAVTRDGRLLASGGEFGTIRIHPVHHLQNEGSLIDANGKNKKKKKTTIFEENQLAVIREGAVRALVFSRNGEMLIAGGYDKSVVVIHTKTWQTVRHVHHDGTVNAMAFDNSFRYLAVGSRDKNITIYDTTTFHPIKEIKTSGWVTDLSWGAGKHESMLAARSGNCTATVFNIQPTKIVKAGMESLGKGSCLAWSKDGRLMARVSDKSVIVAHALRGFDDVATAKRPNTVRAICFCLSTLRNDNMAVVGDDGHLCVYQVVSSAEEYYLELIFDQFLDKDLRSVAWSPDGSLIVCGGKGKYVHFIEASDRGFRQKCTPVLSEGIIFSIAFAPFYENVGLVKEIKQLGLAVGGDDGGGGIVTLFDWGKCVKTLQVTRPRTVRSVKYHPTTPLLAIGDSGNDIVYIDLLGEQVMKEFRSRSRINTIDFSPCGRFIALADDTSFSIREVMTFKSVQEIPARGSDQSLAFSNESGLYLAVDNNNQDARILQLGPLLNPEFIPVNVPLDQLPDWVLSECVYVSPEGPSLLQRYMKSVDERSMEQAVEILHRYPESVFTVNRRTREDCFFAVLRTGKASLMRLVVNLLVTGALDGEGSQSVLTTSIPELGMNALQEMIKFLPPHNIVDIMKEITFIKVPFTEPRTFLVTDKKECASSSYEDPWDEKLSSKFKKFRIGNDAQHDFKEVSKDSKDRLINLRLENVLTPACLPLPGLGSYRFLTTLTTDCPAPVFDNDAMGLVLRIMWTNYIRGYFILDFAIFLTFYGIWVSFLSFTIPATYNPITLYTVGGSILGLNTLYMVKEVYQSHWCKDFDYFRNAWNFIDFLSICFTYLYTAMAMSAGVGNVYLAVFGTLALTCKMLSYMRGFHDTGWLIAVLRQNFQDVRGFVAVLIVILFGFTISFRLVFHELPGNCEIRVDPELREDCQNPPFGTMLQAMFTTFQLALLGSYDVDMFQDGEYKYLASFIFILAVVVVLVVALNALIALLSDSYSRVQEKATANQRKERAELIVEYLSLLPAARREQIEKNTRYFHALLEADSRGDLLVSKDDWQGGLNALRKDLNQLQDDSHEKVRHLFNHMRDDIDKEMMSIRNEIRQSFELLNMEVKRCQKSYAQTAPPALVLGNRGVQTAVNAVSAIGSGAVQAVTTVGAGAVNAVTTVGGTLLHNGPSTLLPPIREGQELQNPKIGTQVKLDTQNKASQGGTNLFSPMSYRKKMDEGSSRLSNC